MTPVRVRLPPAAMRLVKAPVPLIVLAKVRLPERLRTNSPLSVMTAEDRRFVTAYSRIPTLGVFARKLAILQWRCRAEYGVLRNLGMVVRG